MPPKGKNRPGGSPRRRATADIKRRDALVLYVEKHLTFAAIGEALGCNKGTAHHYVREALQEVAKDRRDLAEYALDRELSLIDMEIRQMVEICARPCDACQGQAVTKIEVCPACFGLAKIADETCEKCNGEGRVGQWCRVCAASGCFYSPDERMRAIDRIQRSSDRRAKLLGLYAPERVQFPFDREFYADLEKLPEDELDRELAAFMVGVKTGRAREQDPSGNGQAAPSD